MPSSMRLPQARRRSPVSVLTQQSWQAPIRQKPARGAPLIALTREDLDGYSVEDLKQRIEGLQAEIDRSRAAIEGKSSQRNAADAMFNFRS